MAAHVCFRRMGLRRTKSAIISWAGSLINIYINGPIWKRCRSNVKSRTSRHNVIHMFMHNAISYCLRKVSSTIYIWIYIDLMFHPGSNAHFAVRNKISILHMSLLNPIDERWEANNTVPPCRHPTNETYSSEPVTQPTNVQMSTHIVYATKLIGFCFI